MVALEWDAWVLRVEHRKAVELDAPTIFVDATDCMGRGASGCSSRASRMSKKERKGVV